LDSEPDSDLFNERALVDSGMTGNQARELKVFFEQQEMQQLYLRDQSIREGWDRKKYREEIQALNNEEDSLKNRIGDSAYDAYLYASGQSNGVAVTSVLASAPAGAAGIQAGDHILRYDNQRIYSGFELRQATTGGNGSATDSVPIQVERDGEIFEVYIARGPLGIRMNSVSIAP
jgi:S1-C subfamily serine protease